MLSNFVIHNTENNEKGECDILAIRLRHMKESIYFKGRPEIVSSFDYSDEVLGHNLLNQQRDVYLWVEVTLREKVSEEYVRDKFSDGKCLYVIQRLGIQEWVDMSKLFRSAYYIEPGDNKVFAKVLVSEMGAPDTGLCLRTDVGMVKQELVVWFKRYQKIKRSDWCAWANPLFQGLARGIV